MRKEAIVLAVSLQKGGIAKTTVTMNLGAALTQAGKKVLLVDEDQQGSLTKYAGYNIPDKSEQITLANLMSKVIEDEPIAPHEGILTHPEGFDLVPSNRNLAVVEVMLYNTMCRETVLKRYLAPLKQDYDYILLDCPPSLAQLTTNAFACSDRIIIPTLAEQLSVDEIPDLIKAFKLVKRNINPKLEIDGILPTIVDKRTNFTKDILSVLHEGYGEHLKIYPTAIPRSVKAVESTSVGMSVLAYAPKSPVAQAYRELAEQILAQEKQRNKTLKRKENAR